ncbi:MAG: hypothetical protein IKZ99_08855 [Salinivirgaceae bacterium]|nr:hypothetical protein [Salinivirgaceae bacterium]
MKSIEELTKAQNDLIDEIQAFAESKKLVTEDICPIYDGVADIDAYLKSSLKIMWILKNAYDANDGNNNPNGGGWYLKDVLDSSVQTWRGMAYAIYGFRNDLDWGALPAISQNKKIIDEIKSVAYININKMPGLKSISDSEALYCYNLWKDILNKQIDVYEPDVIIFGGTFRFFYNSDELESSKQECFENLDSKADKKAIVYKYNGKWLISVHHPSRYGGVYIDTLIDALNYVKNHK